MANPLSTLARIALQRLSPRTDAAPPKASRADGWENDLTGWGTSRDKLQEGYYAPDWPLQWTEISNLFYGDDIAATVVNAPIDEAFRKGYSLSAEDSEGAKGLQKWAKEKYDIDSRVQEALIWGRLWGGALLVFGFEDGQDLDQPLRPESVRGIPWVLPIDRRYCQPINYESKLGQRLGKPITYRVNVQGGHSAQSATVHYSRVIQLRGDPVDPIRSRLFGGWDQSVLQRPYKVLRDFAAAFQGTGIMLADASQGVFKLKNLIQMLASGERSALHERMTLLDMGRSTARSILIDADSESFEKVATQFSGVPELLDRYMQRLSACTGIPVSILMGRSAAGMNATGDLDRSSWNAKVASLQSKHLEPLLLNVYRMLALDPTAPKVDSDLSIGWEPLSVPTDAEDATAYSTRANADIAYINAGVLDPAQVAIARFGKGQYSTSAPQVDAKALERELTSAVELAPVPPAPGKAPPKAPEGEDIATAPDDGTDVAQSAEGPGA